VTRVLVAGIGNMFFGDDGFGVEVARRLHTVPPGTRVSDFGIRAVHLAYELLSPLDLLVVVDCMARGGEPGTLYVVEPESADSAALPDAHGISVPAVFALVRQLGGALPPTLVVGCEPETIEPGIGLSPRVARMIPGALDLIRELIASRQEQT
jgi:hydrogenase maturation protease